MAVVEDLSKRPILSGTQTYRTVGEVAPRVDVVPLNSDNERIVRMQGGDWSHMGSKDVERTVYGVHGIYAVDKFIDGAGYRINAVVGESGLAIVSQQLLLDEHTRFEPLMLAMRYKKIAELYAVQPQIADGLHFGFGDRAEVPYAEIAGVNGRQPTFSFVEKLKDGRGFNFDPFNEFDQEEEELDPLAHMLLNPLGFPSPVYDIPTDESHRRSYVAEDAGHVYEGISGDDARIREMYRKYGIPNNGDKFAEALSELLLVEMLFGHLARGTETHNNPSNPPGPRIFGFGRPHMHRDVNYGVNMRKEDPHLITDVEYTDVTEEVKKRNKPDK